MRSYTKQETVMRMATDCTLRVARFSLSWATVISVLTAVPVVLAEWGSGQMLSVVALYMLAVVIGLGLALFLLMLSTIKVNLYPPPPPRPKATGRLTPVYTNGLLSGYIDGVGGRYPVDTLHGSE